MFIQAYLYLSWCALSRASTQVHLKGDVLLAGYVHKLNTNEQLYSHLVRSLDKHSSRLSSNPAAQTHEGGTVDGYTPEALRVGRTLKDDFEKAGIHLPKQQRSRLTALVDLERRIGMQIGTSLSHPSVAGFLT